MLAAESLECLCADRTAIERVYYNHRLGTKPPFEQTLSAGQIEAMVRMDLKKEATLRSVYGVEITPILLAAEVQRINTTTRAPDILADLKSALDHDETRFAAALAKPALVERLLRERFENDDKLHAQQRTTADHLRAQVLAAKSDSRPVADLAALLRSGASNQVQEVSWLMASRPPESTAATAPSSGISTPTQGRATGGPYSVEATVQIAQVLSSPAHGHEERKNYFEDLPAELQRVLKVQLRHPGDVSAVIEMPHQFLLYVAEEVTAEHMKVLVRAIPKRSYEEWLKNDVND